mgnify:CR=1 FL=1
MIEITLIGKVPAKKNRIHRGKGGAMYFDQKGVGAEIEYLEMQIPAECRDLNMEHADTTFQFYLPRDSKHRRAWSSDSDNAVTTLWDVLVKYRVIRDDSFKYNNGRKVIEPAILAEDGVEKTIITLIPKTQTTTAKTTD